MHPLPDYVEIVQDCLYWGVMPSQMLEMPVYWADAGRIVRRAEQEARVPSQGGSSRGTSP